MIHLSSYHSNGLPTVVWSNKVNLIGEKVYKPKIHFCEYCNKPILIYGRLIPCKHVFCFTCATLCLNQQQQPDSLNSASTPPLPGGQNDTQTSPLPINQSPKNNTINNHSNNHHSTSSNYSSENNNHHERYSRNQKNSNYSDSRQNLDLHRSDSNHSLSHRDSNRDESSMIIDDSTSNTTPNTIQLETQINSPRQNGASGRMNGISNGIIQARNNIAASINNNNNIKGCHRCGNRALRVERNTLNSIFVCQIDTCRRTYLSARDLQAHFNHRHSQSKASHNNNQGNSSASLQAISSSPYISSSSLLHLNHHNQNHTSSPSTNISNNNASTSNNNQNSPITHHPNHHHNHHHHRRDRDSHILSDRRDRERDHRDHKERERDRFRDRDRDKYQRERERERNSKEYHRQSMQRAAQWAEASAQMLEKGLTR